MTPTDTDRFEECFEEAVAGRPLSADCAERLAADRDLADQVAVARWLSASRGAALSPAARQRHQAKLQAHLRQRAQPRLWLGLPARRWAAAGAVCAGLVAGGLGVVNVAQTSLPGHALYTVKRGVESARLTLATNEVARGYLHLAYANERLTEAQALWQAGQPVAEALTAYADELRATTTIAQSVAGPAGEALAVEISAVIGDDASLLADLQLEADEASQAALTRAQAAATQALDVTHLMLAPEETAAPPTAQAPSQTAGPTRRPPSRTPNPSATMAGVQPPTETLAPGASPTGQAPAPGGPPTETGKPAAAGQPTAKPTKPAEMPSQTPPGNAGGNNGGGNGGPPQTPPGNAGGNGGGGGNGGPPQTPPGNAGGNGGGGGNGNGGATPTP